MDIIELPDEKTPDNASEKEELQIKDKEGQLILSKIKDNINLKENFEEIRRNTIIETINAGANAITYTPPSISDIFSERMDKYRLVCKNESNEEV